MNELTIKFNRPKLGLNTLTGSNQIVDNFTMWDEVSKPYPATKNVPDWFRQASQWDGRLGTVPTIKKCPPFLDALTTGYIIPFCGDLKVTYTKDRHVQKSNTAFNLFMSSHVKSQYEKTPWKDKPVLKFSSPWVIETPPGWSCLFIHPLNDTESKFKTLSGIVDTDTYRVPVNFPFILDLEPGESIDFTKETAMVQIIPFKRQSWKMETGEANPVEWQAHTDMLGDPGSEAYKKNFHSKKKFT